MPRTRPASISTGTTTHAVSITELLYILIEIGLELRHRVALILTRAWHTCPFVAQQCHGFLDLARSDVTELRCIDADSDQPAPTRGRSLVLCPFQVIVENLRSLLSQFREALRVIDDQPLVRTTARTCPEVTFSVPECYPGPLSRHDLCPGDQTAIIEHDPRVIPATAAPSGPSAPSMGHHASADRPPTSIAHQYDRLLADTLQSTRQANHNQVPFYDNAGEKLRTRAQEQRHEQEQIP